MDPRPPRWAALAIGAAALVALAACGNDDLPEPLDGDLTGGWRGLPEAVGFVPDPEVCHAHPYQPVTPLLDYQPVACDQLYLTQTVHVGGLTDEAAALPAPPAPDSAEHRDAYRECEEQAAEFLGGDFREGRLWLGVAMPSEPGWDGGARWFRCDLMEVESVYGEPVERSGSLAGVLADGQTDASLRLGCYQVEVADGAVEEMVAVGCDEPHDAEFVGAWQAPEGDYPDPAGSDAEEQVYQGCREQVAQYADLPVDGDLIFRTGTIADWMSEQDWRAGDRSFRCYLWLPDRELTGSLAGVGTDGLPIQTE